MSAEVCASCDPNPTGRWGEERCVKGRVYGPCIDGCYRLLVGACECACHQPEKRGQA